MQYTKAVNVLFSLLILVGLISSLLYSLNLDLNSDTVVPGLVAMELVNYHNFDFSFPVNDPYLFTDIFTFHLVPQVLSNYDPTVLRLTAYAMFLLVVGIFSYLIYRYAGLTGSLIFAALATNLPPAAYLYYLSPEFHVGTLLFTGLFLLLFQTDVLKKAPFSAILALSFVLALIVISDSIVIAFFVLPYLFYCLYRYYVEKGETAAGSKKEKAVALLDRKKETSRISAVLVAIALATGLAYVLKTNLYLLGVKIFFISPTTGVSLSNVGANLALYVQSLSTLLNSNLSSLLSNGITGPDLVFAAIFLGVLVYAFVKTNVRAGYLYVMFLAAAVIMLVAFLVTGYADGLWSARFLIYTALSIFAVIALAYKPEGPGLNLNNAFLAAIVLIILTSVASNLLQIPGYDFQPNKEDLDLITYLENNHLTFGFADYGNGNKLIYLSKEEVLYPKVQVINNQFAVYMMLTNYRWYDLSNGHGNYCLLVNKNDTFYQNELSYAAFYTPNQTYQYGGYTIYQYTNVL